MGSVLGVDAIAFWIVVTGAMVGVCGALLGNYLVLRRLSLMGDAISHAILPGLAISFVVTQSRAPLAMLIGAALAGIATAALTEWIRRFAGVPEDAAMGVVFTTLFAAGVVIITRSASAVDLDPGCVLYGILESAALDTRLIAGLEVPRITVTMAAMTMAVIAFVTAFWKELKIVSFDPDLATTVGIRASWIHALLMLMTAAYCVAAFEAVGSILVVAMLIVPPATAYLLTDRLWVMAILAAVLGALASLVGRFGASVLSTSAAGMMAVAAGLTFALTVLFAPRYGYLAKRVSRAIASLNIVREDLLGLLYRLREASPDRRISEPDALAAVGGDVWPRIALVAALRAGEIRRDADTLVLTERGASRAANLIRGHRLWESYLEKYFGVAPDRVHGPADRVEHYLTDDLREDLAGHLGNPDLDPHGRPITDRMTAPRGKSAR